MANTAEIIVRATDEASKVLQDVENNATKSLGGVEAAAEQSAARLAMIATAATEAATAALALGGAFAKSLADLMEYAEGLQKANLSTGVSFELWQKLIKTGNEMGISFDQIRGAIERMEKNLEGSGEALRKFGIVAENFAGLNADEKVRALAVQIMAIEDPSIRAAAAMAATGRSGAEMIPILQKIVDGSVDVQKAFGKDQVEALARLDDASDKAKTAFKTLTQELTLMIANNIPLKGMFDNFASGLEAIGALLNQWPGLWEAMRKGAFETGRDMALAAKAARDNAVELPKLGAAQMAVTEALRQANVAMAAAVKHAQELEKAEDKATKSKEANAKKIEAIRKASIDQISKETEASRKAAEAELKQMNAEAKAEADLTAKILAEEAKRLDAVQKTRQREAEAAERYFERIIENSLRANETEIQGAQRVLEECMRRREELVANVDATGAQIVAADQAVAAAQKAVDDEATRAKIANVTLILDSASTILRALFGKSKAAAIAAAIIDTLSSIVKTLASYPWPWSLAPAAAAAAVGYANVQKIRNTDAGFAQGTPGTSFVDFREGTPAMLHGPEAVVTRPQAEGVASMVEDALAKGLSRGRGAQSPARIDVHVHLDGREIASSVGRRFQAGLVPALAR